MLFFTKYPLKQAFFRSTFIKKGENSTYSRCTTFP